MTREKRSVTINFRTSESVCEMLDAAAFKQNRSRSNYIERLIELDCGYTPSPPLKKSPATNGHAWAFNGRVIKIDQQTYDDWKIQFDKLPSLEVALAAADAAIADNPPVDWMEALVEWLKDQNNIGDGDANAG